MPYDKINYIKDIKNHKDSKEIDYKINFRRLLLNIKSIN